jgi:PAS domain S-box-containing protein
MLGNDPPTNLRKGSTLSTWLVGIVCIVLSAIFLAVDLQLDRRFALGIPQILVVLTAMLARSTWASVAAACVATFSTGLGYLLSPSGDDDAAALVNRMLTLSAVWMTTIAGIAFERGAVAKRRLAEIVEASADAISRLTLDGKVTACNAGMERLYGWPCEEIVGKRVPEPMRGIVARVARGETVPTFDTADRRRDGEPLELSIAVAPLHDARGRITAVSVSARDIAPLKRAERALRELNESLAQRVEERTADLRRSLAERAAEIERRRRVERELRSLTAELLIVEERERRQLAQDLHDGLGQTLTLAIMRLGILEDRLEPAARESLADVESLLCDAQRSSTSLSFRLSPPILYDVGFVPAVQWLCDELERSYGLQVQLDNDERPKTLDDHTRVVVFRCVRELLINVAKHAGTGSACVKIRRSGDQLHLVVTDHGIGFDPAALTNRGFGVTSVRERLEHLGGRLTIASEPGRGTAATIIAPLVRKPVSEARA